MNDEKTALAMGKLVIEFRNLLLTSCPPNTGVIDFSINTVFEPCFDGVAINFAVNATLIDVKTGEMSILDGEIMGHALMGEPK